MNILLVEDDKTLGHMYARKFMTEGWDVTICHDGAEALSNAKQTVPDIIILDLMLPGMSGVDVLQILRSELKTTQIPIVVYTNFGDPYNREKCLTYGADDFILKVESTPESLSQVIRQLVTSKEIEGGQKEENEKV